MNIPLSRNLVRLLTLVPALCCIELRAIDAGGIDVHGSISATASYSDTYNYLGDTRKTLDLNLVDVVLNGTHRFDNGLRVGAQLYAFKIGGYKDIQVDWASLDYSFTQAFGVRAGRVKLPLGLYNDTQDLDSVRTFASLPLTFYAKSFRAITASLDGVSLYGNVSLNKAGSIDYQVYGGYKQYVKGDAPLLKGSVNVAKYDKWKFDGPIFGGSIFWNTPIEGLRLGYSYMDATESTLPGQMAYKAEMHGYALATANMVDTALGAGTWDASFAGTPSSISDIKFEETVYSAEYTKGKWLLAAEYKLIDLTKGKFNAPVLARLGMPAVQAYSSFVEEYYGAVTYQATDKLGLGVYYSHENAARKTAGSNSNPGTYTKDWAAAVSYAVTENWIVKAEVHLMNGRSQNWVAGDDNGASGTANNWTYLVLKSTFTF